MDLDFGGASKFRFPSEMLLITLRGLFSSEPEKHKTQNMDTDTVIHFILVIVSITL